MLIILDGVPSRQVPDGGTETKEGVYNKVWIVCYILSAIAVAITFTTDLTWY